MLSARIIAVLAATVCNGLVTIFGWVARTLLRRRLGRREDSFARRVFRRVARTLLRRRFGHSERLIRKTCPGGVATRGSAFARGPPVASQPRHVFRTSERNGSAYRGKVSGPPTLHSPLPTLRSPLSTHHSHRRNTFRTPSPRMIRNAATASRESIFEVPRWRSTKTMGVSANRAPRRLRCQRISSWKE